MQLGEALSEKEKAEVTDGSRIGRIYSGGLLILLKYLWILIKLS